MALPHSLSASALQERLLQDEALQLVDVREQGELDLARLPYPVLHLPLSCAETWLADLPQRLAPDRPVVVLCHAGVRSWQFCCWLVEHWPPAARGEVAVWNLQGGIEAWSVQVDPSVPRY